MNKTAKIVLSILLVVFIAGSIGLSAWSVDVIYSDGVYKLYKKLFNSYISTYSSYLNAANEYRYGSLYYEYYKELADEAMDSAHDAQYKMEEIETEHYIISTFAIICYVGTAATAIALAVVCVKRKNKFGEIPVNNSDNVYNLSDIPPIDYQENNEPEAETDENTDTTTLQE